MTKEQIIKLYIADLNNLVADSDAKRNRIMELEDELESLKQGQTLPIDSVVVKQSELLCECDAPLIRTSDKGGEYCGSCEKDLN